MQKKEKEGDFAQNLAISQLGNIGLNREHLSAWQQGPDSFEILHSKALVFLSERGIKGKDAIEEINRLSLMQIRALMILYGDGCRGTHLRAYRKDCNDTAFGLPHIHALSCLAKRNIKGLNAINEISELSIAQVRHLACGMSREEALKESTFSQKIDTFIWGQTVIKPAIELSEKFAGDIPEPLTRALGLS